MVAESERAIILDQARSETKRWGGTEPSLTHLAFVLAGRWREEFVQVLGDDASLRVEKLLSTQEFIGDSHAIEALLSVGSRTEVLTNLRTQLESALTQATKAPSHRADTPVDAPEASPEWPAATREFVTPVAKLTDVRFRDREVQEIVAQVTRHSPPIVAVVGDSGSGRTAVLGAVAEALAECRTPRNLWRIGPESGASGNAAARIIANAPDHAVLVFDDLDALAHLDSKSPDLEFLLGIADARFQRRVSIIVVIERRKLSKLDVLCQALADTAERIHLAELPEAVIADVVRAELPAFESHHDVKADPGLVALALSPARPSDTRAHPGLALQRLDAAGSRASLAGVAVAMPEHLGPNGPTSSLASASHDFAAKLSERVKGQPDAIAKVAQRLALTRAGLDLRPGRPNGVFLFVGPTGVGKTELARQLAHLEYGGYDRLIRYDMSEFAQEWAISRLVGPSPGYVGSDEPESWLTTKVAAAPNSVVLLDEIEKAHPRVWNTFLQVFDAGRLTDGRGVTADFKDTVVIMTSNIGIQAAASKAVGFGEQGTDAGRLRQRLHTEIKDQMAPELLNRLDEIVFFDPLSPDAIREIADAELLATQERLSESGWVVSIDDNVTEWLATTGYDPAFGARHLQRNIERELLTKLAASSSRSLHVRIDQDTLVVEPSV